MGENAAPAYYRRRADRFFPEISRDSFFFINMNAYPERCADNCTKPRDRKQDIFREYVRRLPLPPPLEIAEELVRQGYRGQDEQRAALALMAYRHVRRLKRIHVHGEDRCNLPPKHNILMAGPTGCGKTYLVELLFNKIFGIPTIIVDATGFTERGYVGDDVSTILTRLLDIAGGDADLAASGVVCLDEFDKLASSTSNARFAGEGTTKDVSGYGVQRELLKMIEGSDILIPFARGEFIPNVCLSTRDIPFIACGAFSGLENPHDAKKNIGFISSRHDAGEPDVMPEVEAFRKYGFIPEIIGRFTRTLFFPPLSKETLKSILLDNVLPKYYEEFKFEGLRLDVPNGVLDYMVDAAIKRGAGARGLHVELAKLIERAAYENFMRKKNAVVVISMR